MKARSSMRPKKAQLKDKGLWAECWDFGLKSAQNKLGIGFR
jgi:hypothetical protein